MGAAGICVVGPGRRLPREVSPLSAAFVVVLGLCSSEFPLGLAWAVCTPTPEQGRAVHQTVLRLRVVLPQGPPPAGGGAARARQAQLCHSGVIQLDVQRTHL